ncbi:MAG: ABC transporter permease [Gemmatimonadales bacterium]
MSRPAPFALRLLVRLHPPAYRRRFGDAILAFCDDRLAGARARGEVPLRIWARVLADLAISVIAEWLRAIVPRPLNDPGAAAAPRRLSTGDQMIAFAQEFVFAARSLRKSAAFSGAAIATLALGIGSTTAIFSVVESVLLRPLPFPEADRVVVPESFRASARGRWDITYADFMDWRDRKLFDKVAAFRGAQLDLAGPAEPVRVSAAVVTPEFFGALGIAPAKGRLLGEGDYSVSAARAVVISDRMWRAQFGARADIVGEEVELNAIRWPVVGVLPRGAEWPLDADVWVPLQLGSERDPDLQRRDNFVFSSIARLARGRTLAGTAAEMARLASLVAAEHPDIRKGISTVPTPALQCLLGDTTPRALWVLLGAVGLLLLIGCVNVANLQLARAAARQREMAVRTALGASRFRLMRQTFAESVTLAATGGVRGVLLARWMTGAIVAIAPADVPRIGESAVNGTALAFALAASLLVALLFGLAPAVHASRSAPAGALGDGGTRATTGRSGLRTRRALVVLELALSVLLLTGAGLAVRSITHLRGVDVGFDAHPVITASISLPGIRYNSSAKVVGFLYGLRDRLAAAPGIAAAGITTASPLNAGGFYLGRVMIAEGRGTGPDGEVPVNWNVATPGYFAALGMPIARGRDFTAHDDSAGTPVMIVSESFARAMFPGQEAIGKRAMSSRDEKVYREVVGVVRDVKFRAVRDTTQSLVWVPYAQNAWHFGIVTVRSSRGAAAALRALRRELGAMDHAIALANVTTMDEAMSRSIASDRLVATLLGVFATLALALAAVGIFGVLSYMVEQRMHELGIRVALGAQARDVLGLVARETLPMVGIGVATGLVAAFTLGRLLRSMFYEVQPGDPLTFAGVALTLSAIGVVAALVPARRAVRVDPVIALRSD